MEEDIINRNKRKFQDEISEVRVAKHTCLCLEENTQSNTRLDDDYGDMITNSMSAKDSNSFTDSVMSDSLMRPHSTSSSVNWSGTSETKTCDEISSHTFPGFEDCEFSSSECETKQSEALMEDLFCSNAVDSVLSSGRWNVNQDSEQGTEKLTIDKEFEQYFSMLML